MVALAHVAGALVGPKEVLPTPPMPCTAARPTDACFTPAGFSCIRMASRRSSSPTRPVKLAIRGGTPMNGRWRGWRCLRLAFSSGDDATLAFLGIRYAHEVLVEARWNHEERGGEWGFGGVGVSRPGAGRPVGHLPRSVWLQWQCLGAGG